jgi:hypothetical protein
MSRRRIGTIAAATLVLSLAVPATSYGQLGHRVSRDWTIGVESRRSANDGYNSDFRRIGLTEYEGDVTGTYISWGFGGIKTAWSAPAILGVGAAPFAVCLVIGALACACAGKRHVRSDK